MSEKKPTLDYREPEAKQSFWRTSRGERVHLMISIATLLVIAGLVFAGCHFI